jgi:hypothetical protein
MVTMSQKSSLPQTLESVSKALTPDKRWDSQSELQLDKESPAMLWRVCSIAFPLLVALQQDTNDDKSCAVE